MNFLLKVIQSCFVALFVVVPLIFLPQTSELFEFNKLTLTWIITTIIVGTWAVRCILEKKFIFKRTLLDIPLIIFLIAQSLSLLFSIDPQTSLLGYYGRWNGGLLSLVSYALLYWAFVSNMDKISTKKTIAYSLLPTAFFVAIYGILQHFGIDAHKWVQDVQTRVFSTLGQPNWLAAYLVALTFIPLNTAINSKNKKTQSLNLLIALLLFICLLFTKSRSGLLAFGISSLIFWFIQIKNYKLKIFKNYLIISIWGLLFLLTLVIPNPIRDLIIKSNTPPPTGAALESGGTESGEIRKIVWRGAIDAWKSSPKTILVGSGPETFAMIYYQFRPIEHNNTSEWELLYNKAHNEFLNYLTTTGILGLGSYILLLTFMGIRLRGGSEGALQTALLAGWTSILITNFWGFSVVIVQLLLFLLPAFAITLSIEPIIPKPKTITKKQVFLIILLLVPIAYCLMTIFKYWLADTHYATAQKLENQFTQSENPSLLVEAFNSSTQAYELNPNEAVINSQLGNLAAYLSVLTLEVDATSSAELAALAAQSSARAIELSPSHPSHYKSASRAYILLSTFDQSYLTKADDVLKLAQLLSPTDPRLPFNRGVIAKYQNASDSAKLLFQESLKLKPDFADSKNQLK